MAFLPVLAGPLALGQEICFSLSLLPAASQGRQSVSHLVTQREVYGLSLGELRRPECEKRRGGDKKPLVFSLIPGLTEFTHSASSPPELLQLCLRSSYSWKNKSLCLTPETGIPSYSVSLIPSHHRLTALSVEMSSLWRKKSHNDSFERENPVTKCIKNFAEQIRFI